MSCLLTTAPKRLALMARDAHPDIRGMYWTTQPAIDSAMRPCVVIEDSGGEANAQQVATADGTETYRVVLMGAKWGQGAAAEHELKMREIAQAVYRYYLQRPSLVYSNLRAMTDYAAAGPLIEDNVAVRWHRLQRSAVGMVSLGAEESFWGCILTVTLTTGFGFREIIR